MTHHSEDFHLLVRQVEDALVAQPDHPGLLAALAGLRLQQSQLDVALPLLERAAALAPDDARILSDYGAVLCDANRASEAEAVLQKVMAAGEFNDNVVFNLARSFHLQHKIDAGLSALAMITVPADDVFKLRGDLFKEKGDWREAATAYLMALQLNPDNAAYLNDLGVLLELNGSAAEQLALWESLISRDTIHPIAYFFLGNALAAHNRLQEALCAYEEATRRVPTMAEALNNQALVLGKLGRENEAFQLLQRASEANPALVAAKNNLGSILARNNALNDAETVLAKAVALEPDNLDVRVNYGALLMRQRRFDEAEAQFRYVLGRDPGNASAELNMGLLKLNVGDWASGWPYYESRWKMPQLADKRPQLATPLWSGEPLDGKTVFVFSEQGFGDNIQFVRYLDELHRRYPSAKLVFYTLHSLTRLFQKVYVADWCQILAWGEPIPEHDVHIPLLSVPWRVGTDVGSIPDHVPYLSADPELAAVWEKALGQCPGLKVGLVWSSSETFIYRSAKTVALETLRPMFDVDGIAWVNLQFGKEAQQITDAGLSGRFFDPMPQVKDFADTAAIIAALDLVITVDTAVAHLAGALARPVWMLDRFDTDWRWLPPREDSPWYPTMAVFRQTEFGEWGPVMERVLRALKDRLACCPRTAGQP